METDSIKRKKNRRKKSRVVISFDDEVVTKDEGEKILETVAENSLDEKSKKGKKNNVMEPTEVQNEEGIVPKMKSKKRKKKEKTVAQNEQDEAISQPDDQEEVVEEVPKKKKRNQLKMEENQNESTDGATKKQTESIRALKRKRHSKLLEEKKMKTELILQQKGLNYLSKWKHSRQDWKFEKLRQVWLQQNMYDTVKIPEEFWTTLIEYFTKSQGKIRDIILSDAVKKIEAEADNEDEETKMKLQRARDIVQNLQE